MISPKLRVHFVNHQITSHVLTARSSNSTKTKIPTEPCSHKVLGGLTDFYWMSGETGWVLFQQHKQLQNAQSNPCHLDPLISLPLPFLFSPIPKLLLISNEKQSRCFYWFPDICKTIAPESHFAFCSIFLNRDDCLRRIPVPAVGHPCISILSTPS